MAEEFVGGVADLERHSCTPKRRTAGGDRSPTGGVVGSSTVASEVGCNWRRAGQRWLASWGVISGLVHDYTVVAYSVLFVSTTRYVW